MHSAIVSVSSTFFLAQAHEIDRVNVLDDNVSRLRCTYSVASVPAGSAIAVVYHDNLGDVVHETSHHVLALFQ